MNFFMKQESEKKVQFNKGKGAKKSEHAEETEEERRRRKE